MKKLAVFNLIIITLLIFMYVQFEPKKEEKPKFISRVGEKQELDINSDEYNYLPEEIKEYIQNEYNETGNIILTEKNKIEGESYLNPEYVEYIKKEKKFAAAPPIIINDYVGNTDTVSESTYDIKSHTTALKHQGSLGLCWAFAGLSSFETALYTDYNKKLAFSERQIDYATAMPYEHTAFPYRGNIRTATPIVEQYNPYHIYNKELGGGGNFGYVEHMALQGVSPTLDSTFGSFNVLDHANVYNSKNLSDVINSNNLKYIATGSERVAGANMKELKKENKDKYDSIINYIKNAVYNEGSLYVSTVAPQVSSSGVCYNPNLKLINYLGNNSSACKGYTSFGTHAMAIIGWDDNFEYNYCVNDGTITSDTSDTCAGTYVSGKGAWILRNSWGNNESYPYFAYDSNFLELGHFTSVTENDNFNIYDEKMLKNKKLNSQTYNGLKQVKFTKGTFKEKIKRISFFTSSSNASYDIYINDEFQKTVSKEYPGIVSVEINDYEVNSKTFDVRIESSLKNTTNISNVVVYTKDTETNEKSFQMDNISIKFIDDGEENIELFANTRGFETGKQVSFELSIENNLTDNYIINNKLQAKMRIPSSVSDGTYNLITKIDGEVVDNNTTITISHQQYNNLSGSGTENDPYLITNALDFLSINKDKSAYYKITNDLDFEDVIYTPIGKEGNTFSGYLDGDNHILKNIYILSNDDYQGLFGFTKNATIKNMIIENIHVSGNNYVGGLSGYSYMSSINNIKIIKGVIKGIEDVGGVVGVIDKGTTTRNLKNYASVIGEYEVGGIAGVLFDSNLETCYNVGSISSESTSGGIIGYVFNDNLSTIMSIQNSFNVGNVSIIYDGAGGIAGITDGYINLSDCFNTGTMKADEFAGGIIGASFSRNGTIENTYSLNTLDFIGYEYAYEESYGITYSNIHYDNNLGNTINTASKISLESLDSQIFTNHNSTYPTLINNDFYFISSLNTNDIDMKISEEVNLDTIVYPENASYKTLNITSSNKDILQINDNKIKCLNEGNTLLTINTLDSTNIKETLSVTCKNDIKSIELIKVPTKTTYLQFEDLDVTDGKLKITYLDNKTKEIDITKNMIQNFDSTTVNENLVLEIIYEERKFYYSVRIDPLTFSITTSKSDAYEINAPEKVNYNSSFTFTVTVNEGYNKDNMKVLVNGDIVVPDSNMVYTVYNVRNNVTITIIGVDKPPYLINDDLYTCIIPTSKEYKEFNKEDLINNLNITENYTIKSFDDEDINPVNIGTGMKIVSTKSYSIVIRGDVTGDGKINQGDVAKLYNHYRGNIKMEGYFLEAAKIRGSDAINQGDVAKLYNYYRGNINSLES
ncbi:MAG: hypothetical protein PUA68_07285 [Bacilli bacterium]|nr:hypothetical protein [Bacilli bacterium]